MEIFRIPLAKPVYFFKAGDFSADAGWTHPRLRHTRDFEVFLGIAGEVPLAFDRVRTVLRPGACVIAPPGVTVRGTEASRSAVRFLWLHFVVEGWSRADLDDETSPPAAADLERVRRREFAPRLNELCILGDHFVLQDPARTIVLMSHLLDVANSYRYTQREADLLTGALLAELSHGFLSRIAAHEARPRAFSTRIIEWVRANMSSTLTVAAVAEHFQLHPDYLSRKFRAEQGRSMRDYLVQVRLDSAKLLLVRTDLPVAQVARHAFFSDPKHFMKLFRARIGLTAREYRESAANTHYNNPVVDPMIPVPREIALRIEGLEP